MGNSLNYYGSMVMVGWRNNSRPSRTTSEAVERMTDYPVRHVSKDEQDCSDCWLSRRNLARMGCTVRLRGRKLLFEVASELSTS